MNESNRAFRDYATRVSFNPSLSRNQVGHLAGIIAEIEAYEANKQLGWIERTDICDDAIGDVGANPRLFIVGRGSLKRMGLVEDDPRWVKEMKRLDKIGHDRKRKYEGPSYRLTAAGTHVVELLRIAGLLAPRASNLNAQFEKKSA